MVHLYHKYLSFCPVGLLFTGYKIDPWIFFCVSGEWKGQMMFFFYCLIFFPSSGGRFPSRTRLLYEWTILCYPLLLPPIPSHFLSSLSSTSPLLPCCSSNWWLEVWRKQGGGLKAGQIICSLPVEAYVTLQCWGGSECGSRSYAGNVSLCSARAGPENNSI